MIKIKLRPRDELIVRKYVKEYSASEDKELFKEGLIEWRYFRIKFLKDHNIDYSKDYALAILVEIFKQLGFKKELEECYKAFEE
ncbi:hypothetical protein ACFQ3R_07510 [Mesonia ostreae]|uniref:Uncharacterized protein n=1 Tax=Mesonia ostreae TaxID=861110 RepID=A0ABU2KHI7_9FLAO|nr:hypothetical protein [Mesonia ostreae]MDT0294182.1 hypothetical protein [Mesonia ostreae]